MEHPPGEVPKVGLRLGFDRRLKLEFHGSKTPFHKDRAMRLTRIMAAASTRKASADERVAS